MLCYGNKDEEESKEPDYNKIELEEKQEEETGEAISTISTTTNQVF
jgi:hypothetical protein